MELASVKDVKVNLTEDEEVKKENINSGVIEDMVEIPSDVKNYDETDLSIKGFFGFSEKKDDVLPCLAEEKDEVQILEDGWLDKYSRIREEDQYKIEGSCRGVCLIFDNDKFDKHLRMGDRQGSARDQELAKNMFQDLGFKVEVHSNKSRNEIKNILEECADEDHKDADALAVVILSHGDEGILYAKDHPYQVECVWNPFTADKCQDLRGKPKLFFIQACQGSQYDDGCRSSVCRTTSVTSADNLASYKIPSHADFLIAHSTVTGFYAWRNTGDGSWFIQALVAAVSANKEDFDLLTIMAKTTELVTMFESNCSRKKMNRKKQTPFVHSTLTKRLFLTNNKIQVDKIVQTLST